MTAHDNQVQPNTNKPEHGPRDVDAVNKWSKHPNHNNNLYSRQLVLPLQSSLYEVLFTATAEPYTYIDQLARFMDTCSWTIHTRGRWDLSAWQAVDNSRPPG